VWALVQIPRNMRLLLQVGLLRVVKLYTYLLVNPYRNISSREWERIQEKGPEFKAEENVT
jgi:hypothetical protein